MSAGGADGMLQRYAVLLDAFADDLEQAGEAAGFEPDEAALGVEAWQRGIGVGGERDT